MRTEGLLRLARVTRPFMRYRTPVAHRLCKGMLALLCPKARRGRGQELVAPFEGGSILVDTSSSLEYSILFRGCHEPEITRLIRTLVRPGAVCLDAGANIGSHTLVMARAAGPAGRVVAMEPHPDIHRRLLENLALNGLDNVEALQLALAGSDGSADFFGFGADAFHQGGSSLLPDEEATEKMQVRTITGRTLCRDHDLDRCRFVKIDVEGAEGTVLRELWEMIGRGRPHVIFEYRAHHWRKFGSEFDEWSGRFQEAGYALHYIRKNATRPLRGTPPESCEILCVPMPATS